MVLVFRKIGAVTGGRKQDRLCIAVSAAWIDYLNGCGEIF